jgi:hypothetical protein
MLRFAHSSLLSSDNEASRRRVLNGSHRLTLYRRMLLSQKKISVDSNIPKQNLTAHVGQVVADLTQRIAHQVRGRRPLDVVAPLEDRHVLVQVLLAHAPERPQEVPQPGPQPLQRVDVDLADAVAVVPRPARCRRRASSGPVPCLPASSRGPGASDRRAGRARAIRGYRGHSWVTGVIPRFLGDLGKLGLERRKRAHNS